MRAKGIEPDGYVPYTYAAIHVFAPAAEAAGSTEIDALIAQLRNRTFDTVLGDISFDEKGDVTAPGYVFYEWKNGSYDYTDM